MGFRSDIKINYDQHLGDIQQLRGQEEGEGGQPKVHTCPPLNVHMDQNLKKSTYFRKYFIPLVLHITIH